MKMLDRLRNRTRGEAGNGSSGNSGQSEGQLPIKNYDRLDERTIGTHLRELTQSEMADVEKYERANRSRPAVLDKLRYMRTTEPLEGYDSMSPEQVIEVLEKADSEQVKGIRDYERKFAQRTAVLEAAARVLPGSGASARETQIGEEKAARVSAGIAGRAKTSDALGDD